MSFADYPPEITSAKGFLVNCRKRPINIKNVCNLQPTIAEIENNHAKLFLLKEWEKPESAISLNEAAQSLEKVRSLYPGKEHEFGLGISCSCFPDLIFFERDAVFDDPQDKEHYQEKDTFGQMDFEQHCKESGYHIGSSASGKSHYIMQVSPELKKIIGNEPFKYGEARETGEFEISFLKGQWNETGNLISRGPVIPATDAAAVEYVNARLDRQRQRKKTVTPKAKAKKGTTKTIRESESDEIDYRFYNNLIQTCKGNMKRQLLDMMNDKNRERTRQLDLSSEMMSLTDKLVIRGVPNVKTYLYIMDKSSLHQAYIAREKEHPELKDRWREDKLIRTYQKAVLEVTESYYLNYDNLIGETTKEVSRAIDRYNETTDAPIYFSSPAGAAIEVPRSDVDKITEIDVSSCLAKITTKDYKWVSLDGTETKPCKDAVSAALSAANLPPLQYATNGAWIDRDGNIICKRGYYDGVFLRQDIEVQPLPEKVTDADLKWAHDMLVSAFKGFLFEHGEDGVQDCIYVFGCELLHPTVKYAIPALIINKNKPGVGGSLLSSVLVIMRHNCAEFPQSISLSESRAEVHDTMLANAANHNKGYGIYDNLVNSAVFGELGLMMHSGTGAIESRLKYGKFTSTIDTKKDYLYNGNNIDINSDFAARRALEVRLYYEGDVSTIKFPHGDKESTIQYARENHANFVRAFAIGVKSWVQNGKPPLTVEVKGNWNEYTPYHNIIGGALEALGFTRYLQHLYETQVLNNDSTIRFCMWMEALWNVFPGDEFTAADFWERLNSPGEGYVELKSVFANYIKKDARSLGRLLQRMYKQNIVAGSRYKLEVMDVKPRNKIQYVVVEVAKQTMLVSKNN